MLLFSYGANLASQTILKRNLNPISSHPARILDETIAISFQHRAAFATLVKTQGFVDTELCISRPYGVVHRLTLADLQKVQEREVGYKLYRLKDVHLLDSNETVECQTFMSTSWMILPQPMPPTDRYKSLIISGCLENDIAGLGGFAYVEWLRRVPSVEPRELSLDYRYSDTPSEKTARAFGVFIMLCVTYCMINP